MRISYWSSNVCSSDLKHDRIPKRMTVFTKFSRSQVIKINVPCLKRKCPLTVPFNDNAHVFQQVNQVVHIPDRRHILNPDLIFTKQYRGNNLERLILSSLWDDLSLQCLPSDSSEEHTSELQSLMRISYAAFCLQ